MGFGRGSEKPRVSSAWRIWEGFLERCLEPNDRVWVEFKHRKICEGSPPGWNRRRGQSGKEWGQAWDLEQAVLAGTPQMRQRTCDIPSGGWGGVSPVGP